MKTAAIRMLPLLVAVVLGGSCADLATPSQPIGVERGEVTTTSGVKFHDTFLGSGPAAVSGDEVIFEYTVWLENGMKVDSTSDRGYPVKVVLGKAQIKGWNDGLLGIQSQGERRIIVPPELAYGVEGLPGMIPPNSTLTFQVHVLAITHPKS